MLEPTTRRIVCRSDAYPTHCLRLRNDVASALTTLRPDRVRALLDQANTRPENVRTLATAGVWPKRYFGYLDRRGDTGVAEVRMGRVG